MVGEAKPKRKIPVNKKDISHFTEKQQEQIEAKRLRQKESAKKSRDTKKQYQSKLESDIANKEIENQELKTKLTTLENNEKLLQEKISEFEKILRKKEMSNDTTKTQPTNIDLDSSLQELKYSSDILGIKP